MASPTPTEPEPSDMSAALDSVSMEEDFQHSPRFVEARDGPSSSAPPAFLVHHLHTPLAASLARRQVADPQSSRKKMPKSRDSSTGPPRVAHSGNGNPTCKGSAAATSAVPPLSRSLSGTKIMSPTSVDTNSTQSRSSGSGLAPRKLASTAGGGCRTNVKVVVRCRPMTAAEQRDSHNVVDVCTERNEVIVRLRGGGPAGLGKPLQNAGGPAGGSGTASRTQNATGGSNSSKIFRFDGVCPVSTSQKQFFEQHAQPLVDEVLQGFNCTIFAYGQTGTGKTFTVEGAPRGGDSLYSADDDIVENADCGLIGRSVQRIFSTLRGERAAKDYTVTCSFLEIYNEELIDLFSPPGSAGGCPSSQSSLCGTDLNDSQASQSSLPTPRLRIYEDQSNSPAFDSPAAGSGGAAPAGSSRAPQQGRGVVRVEGLEEKEVKSERDVFALLRAAAPRRSFAASSANAHSSRSHTIFSISVCIRDTASALAVEEAGELASLKGRRKGAPSGFAPTAAGAPVEEEVVRVGKLNLVDLAGSENIYKSWGATAEEKRRREALTINKSLLTLGRCINALVDGASYVPYRDSKLTRLLQDSLGGCTKTCLIATISPAENVVEETVNTLDYAYRAKSIQNLPVKTLRHSKSLLLSSLLHENQQLKLLLSSQRERDGVFLPLPLYTQHEQQMRSQQEQLERQENQIRRLEECVQQQEAELKSFAEVKSRLQIALEERESVEQKAAELAARLDAAGAKTRDLEAQLRRREAEETFLLEQLTQELQREHEAAASARCTLEQAVQELVSVASHQKATLVRSRERARETSVCFAQVVDAACTELGHEQSRMHSRLEASLKALSAQEDVRAAAAAKTAALLQDHLEAQRKQEEQEHERRGERLERWRHQAEVHCGQATEGIERLELEFQRLREKGKGLLGESGRRARATLEHIHSQVRKGVETSATLLEEKAGDEAKQREQAQLLVTALVEKEALHTSSTAEALDRLARELGLWKETQERHLVDATAQLVSTVQRQMQLLATHHQDGLERHVQSLQRQLKMLRDEQTAQGNTVKAMGGELAAASDGGGAAVSALASAARTGFDSLLATLNQAAEEGCEAAKAQETAAAAAFEDDAQSSQTHFAALKDRISAHREGFRASLEQAAECERKSAVARAEAAQAACEASCERQAEEERLRGVARGLLGDIREVAQVAETHRREALTKQQQRAGEFAKAIRRELPAPCAGQCPVSPDQPVSLAETAGGRPSPCHFCAVEASMGKWTNRAEVSAASSKSLIDGDGDFSRLPDLLRRRFHDLEQGSKGSESHPEARESSALASESATASSSLSPLTTGCSDSDAGTSSPEVAFTEKSSGLLHLNLGVSSDFGGAPSTTASPGVPSEASRSTACALSVRVSPADTVGVDGGDSAGEEEGRALIAAGEQACGEGDLALSGPSDDNLEEATEDEAENSRPSQPRPAPSKGDKSARRTQGDPRRRPTVPLRHGKGLVMQRPVASVPCSGSGASCRPSPGVGKSTEGLRKGPSAVVRKGDVDTAKPHVVSRGVVHRQHDHLSPLKNAMKGTVAATSASACPIKAVPKTQSAVENFPDLPAATEDARRGGAGNGEVDKRARAAVLLPSETAKSRSGNASRDEDERQRHGLRRRRSSDGLFLGLESEKKKPNTDAVSPCSARFATCAPCGSEGGHVASRT